jgi:hypothetical protein
MREPGHPRYAVIGVVRHRPIAPGERRAPTIIVIAVAGETRRKPCKHVLSEVEGFTLDYRFWEGICGAGLQALAPVGQFSISTETMTGQCLRCKRAEATI